MRFLLVYDGPKAQENMKNFFMDMYDAFVKVSCVYACIFNYWTGLYIFPSLILGITKSILRSKYADCIIKL